MLFYFIKLIIMSITIYHNPNWSKSRQSLELLREKNIKLKVVEYIKTPPSSEDLQLISIKLNLSPKEFLRKNDIRYKELNIDSFNGSDDELFQIIIENPRILERPIITSNDKAVIGRPPENLLELFNK